MSLKYFYSRAPSSIKSFPLCIYKSSLSRSHSLSLLLKLLPTPHRWNYPLLSLSMKVRSLSHPRTISLCFSHYWTFSHSLRIQVWVSGKVWVSKNHLVLTLSCFGRLVWICAFEFSYFMSMHQLLDYLPKLEFVLLEFIFIFWSFKHNFLACVPSKLEIMDACCVPRTWKNCKKAFTVHCLNLIFF